MLSRRLKELVRPTIQSSERPTLMAVESVRCQVKPSATAVAARMTSLITLVETLMERMSSTSPSPATRASRTRIRHSPGLK